MSISNTKFPASGSFTNIMDGSTRMSVKYSATTSVLEWQWFSLGSMVGITGTNESYRLPLVTTEDLLFNSELHLSYSKYDNSLKLIGF
ncbi:MAG: hypothetical protein SH817_02775 [Leptospira sp.]|nr:hypothetical protein [Leptospira sp.]